MRLFPAVVSAGLLLATPGLPQRHEVALGFCVITSLDQPVTDILWLRVDDLWHRGEYEEIFPILRLLTRLDPNDLQAWELGAWFLSHALGPRLQGRKEEMEELSRRFLEEGIRRNPDHYLLHWEMAYLLYRRGDLEQALTHVSEAAQFPHPYKVERLQAQILTGMGRRREAFAVWREIRSRYPEMSNVADRFLRELSEDSQPDSFRRIP